MRRFAYTLRHLVDRHLVNQDIARANAAEANATLGNQRAERAAVEAFLAAHRETHRAADDGMEMPDQQVERVL